MESLKTMKPITPAQKKIQLNAKLLKLKNMELQNWLKEASDICPELATALEGIYCGRDGEIHEQLSGDYNKLWLAMGWYTVSTTPKVEYAYIS